MLAINLLVWLFFMGWAGVDAYHHLASNLVGPAILDVGKIFVYFVVGELIARWLKSYDD